MIITDHASYVNLDSKNNFDPIFENEYAVRKANKKAKKDFKKSSKTDGKKFKSNQTNSEQSKNNFKLEARTPTQKVYLNWLNDFNTHILFGIGPAGSGKTYLASKWAALAFIQGVYDKIIIVRPTVDAGEKLGF